MKTRFYQRLLIDDRLKKLNTATLTVISISENLKNFAKIMKYSPKILCSDLVLENR
jgi:hypothetical protein